jgi:hypothetical protein
MRSTIIARTVALVAVAAGVSIGVKASAAVPPAYRWTQTGTVGIVVGGTWDGSIVEGTPFTATLDYRSTSSLSYPPGTHEARYDDAPISATFTAGNYHFRFDASPPGFSPTIGIFDNQIFGPLVADGYMWLWQTPDVQYGLHDIFLSGFLLSFDLDTVTSPALDIHAYPISQFNFQRDRQFVAYDSNGNLHELVCYLSDYSIMPIPEPTAGALVGSAIFFVALSRSRSQCSRRRQTIVVYPAD